MEVTAAESESTYTRAAWVAASAKPWPLLGGQIQRAIICKCVVGFIDLDRRRQHLVLKRHNGLDQAGYPCRSLGVADLGLDRTNGAPGAIWFRLSKHVGQCSYLSCITDSRTCSVRFDQFDRIRGDARKLVGASQCLHLAFGTGRVDSITLAVAGSAYASQHSVDAVAIAPGIGKTFCDDDAEAFAQDSAVGIRVERPGVTGRRKCLRLAEARVHEDVVERVDSAGQHHVRSIGLQLEARKVHCTQRTCASGIDDAVASAKVKPIRDASRCNVAKQTGEGVLLPGHVAVAYPLDDIIGCCLVYAGFGQRASPQRVA